MHGTVVEHGSDDHNGRNYMIRVTNMGHTITRTERHLKAIPITAENYLRNEMSTINRPQTSD